MKENQQEIIEEKKIKGWKIINKRPSFTDNERKEEYKKILIGLNKNLNKFDN